MTEDKFVTVTTNDKGECILVSWQNEDHQILSVIWEAPEKEPSKPVGYQALFNAISEATCIQPGGIGVSVEAFTRSIGPLFSRPVPAAPVRLTDEEIGLLIDSITPQPWGIGSRRADGFSFARSVEAGVLRKQGYKVEN